eukprot:7296729-Prymnesium_polylepis.1
MRASQGAAGCSHPYMQWRLKPTVKLMRAQRRSPPPCARGSVFPHLFPGTLPLTCTEKCLKLSAVRECVSCRVDLT